jgi:EAL domain-containing protein (putative c-di-GMP-specific phosphodiesterase class I)
VNRPLRSALGSMKRGQSRYRLVADAYSMATAIISMGRSLGLRVVAEGVETEAELEFLQAHQWHEAQGYYFGRPVPSHEFANLLATGPSDAVLRGAHLYADVSSGTLSR